MCIYSGLTRGIISKNSDTNKTNMQKIEIQVIMRSILVKAMVNIMNIP